MAAVQLLRANLCCNVGAERLAAGLGAGKHLCALAAWSQYHSLAALRCPSDVSRPDCKDNQATCFGLWQLKPRSPKVQLRNASLHLHRLPQAGLIKAFCACLLGLSERFCCGRATKCSFPPVFVVSTYSDVAGSVLRTKPASVWVVFFVVFLVRRGCVPALSGPQVSCARHL